MTAEHTDELHYQWYFRPEGGSDEEVGEDSPTLTLKNLDLGWDKFSFWCVVSNEPGEATSGKAQLTVLKKVVFVDMAETAYYKEPVAWAVDKGITNGTTDTTFSPNNTCTRAQIVTFLWRAFGA